MKGELINVAIAQGTEFVTKFIAKALGGPLAAISLFVDSIRGFIDNCEELSTLPGMVLEGLQSLAQGEPGAVGKVADLTEGFVKQIVGPVVGWVATALGVGGLRATLRKAIDSVAGQVGKFVKDAFRKLLDLFCRLLPKLCPRTTGPSCKLGPSGRGSCFIAGTPVRTPRGPVPIEELRVGDRVVTFAETERGGVVAEETPVDPPTLRLLRLHLTREDGSDVALELLRSPEWIDDHGAAVGGSVWLDLPEMGAEGSADVLAIDDCPPLADGPGRLVTGTFRHASGDVLDVAVDSEDAPLGVTGTHPFWSRDREAWVPAADLRVGETLDALTGPAQVEKIEARDESESVWNIEVDGDHTYRVGESGLLVHNASVPSCCRLFPEDHFKNHPGRKIY